MKCTIIGLVLGAIGLVRAGTYDNDVKLLAANSGNMNESTFVTNIVRTKYGWSDGKDPHSGTNYYCACQLCTPAVKDGSYEFKGDRLTLAASMRFLADGQTVTVGDLILEAGANVKVLTGAWLETFRGNMTVKGTVADPVILFCGGYASESDVTSGYVISSELKGDASACLNVELWKTSEGKGSICVTPHGQYVRLDAASQYAGTIRVLDTTALKLCSDLPGTIVATNGATVEVSAGRTIGSLDLEAGTTLDLSAGGTLTVSDRFAVSNGVTLVLAERETAGACAVLTVPVGKGSLDAAAFSLPSETARGRLWTETAGGIQTLYYERMTFGKYDATTGFVTRLGSDKNPFDLSGSWSDGQIVHAGTNYYSAGQVHVTTNSVFVGRSLTLGPNGNFRISNNTLHVADLRVNSGGGGAESVYTTAGGSGTTSLSGGMTVLSRVTDAWPFAFFGGNDGQTWSSDQTIHGDADSALVARGHYALAPGAVNNYVELTGDLMDFRGALIVLTNETVRLGNVASPCTVRLGTAYSHLSTRDTAGTSATVGALDVRASTSVNVPADTELTVSGTLALSDGVTLTKNGAGVLTVGGTPTVGAGGALSVSAGYIRALSETAFAGLAVTLADGAGIAVDVTQGIPLALPSGVAAAGTVSVVLRGVDPNASCGKAVLVKVPVASAADLAEKIRVRRVAGFHVSAPTAGAAGADGLVPISVTYARIGFAIFVR